MDGLKISLSELVSDFLDFAELFGCYDILYARECIGIRESIKNSPPQRVIYARASSECSIYRTMIHKALQFAY